MSTKPGPRNLGIGMRELQRIQGEGLAEVVRVCGNCKHHSTEHIEVTCQAPLPIWVYNCEWNTKSKRPSKKDEQAIGCECFERKDAK